MSDKQIIQNLAQQNCGGIYAGTQSYYISKTVEQQIEEADPKRLMEWHTQIRERIALLHKTATEAYEKLYPKYVKLMEVGCCSANRIGYHCDCKPCGMCSAQHKL